MDFCQESTSVGLPLPDGVIDSGDRSHYLYLYSGIPLEETQKYSGLNDLYCLFGFTNIRTWADITGNKDPVEINQRIAQLTTLADNFINVSLFQGPYKTPFEKPTNKIIVDLSARITGVYLYEDRGITDSGDSQKHELTFQYKKARQYIDWILSRKMRLDRATTIATVSVPSFNGKGYQGFGNIGSTSNVVYCTRQNVEDIYGPDNVIKWADLDNDRDSNKIEDRIVCIIDKATEEIECRLRDGPYKIPFIAPFDKVITDICARLTGVMLYELRGIQDSDSKNDDLLWHRKQVDQVIDGIMARKYRLVTNVTLLRESTPVAV